MNIVCLFPSFGPNPGDNRFDLAFEGTEFKYTLNATDWTFRGCDFEYRYLKVPFSLLSDAIVTVTDRSGHKICSEKVTVSTPTSVTNIGVSCFCLLVEAAQAQIKPIDTKTARQAVLHRITREAKKIKWPLAFQICREIRCARIPSHEKAPEAFNTLSMQSIVWGLVKDLDDQEVRSVLNDDPKQEEKLLKAALQAACSQEIRHLVEPLIDEVLAERSNPK